MVSTRGSINDCNLSCTDAMPLPSPCGNKKGPRKALVVPHQFVLGSGGRIRTCDLRVMSPTSCQTAPPRTGARMIVGQAACGKRFRGSVVDRHQQGIVVKTGRY